MGIIILRALLLIVTLLLILWRLKKWNVSFYISFIYIFLLYPNIFRHIGERPVLFTILFTPLTFIILEDFKDKVLVHLKEGCRGTIFLLIPLMLLWSNLQGGFIIGNIIIVVYMLSEGLKIIFKKISYTRQELIIFYIATTLALLISYINPTGWDAFSIALSPKYTFLEKGIQEYESPFVLYKNRLAPINYAYITLVSFFPLILIMRNKKMDLTHIILISGLFVMAIKTGRYAIYYTLIAAMVLGRETDILLIALFKKRISESGYQKVVTVFSILALLSSIIFFTGVFKFKWLKLDISRSYVPEAAVNFIEKNNLYGNILNSDPYGGYVIWRLYPWKKNFVDTRWLNYTVKQEYAWMMGTVESIYNEELPEGKKPLWKRLLEHYNIDFILIDTFDVYGTVPGLLLTLVDDKEWVPVYSEPIAVIFVKDILQNQDVIKQHRIPKEDVYNTVIGITSQMAIYDRKNPKYLISLGRTFYEMGRLEDALTAYQYAFKRFPREAGVKEIIKQIESELKHEGKDEKH